MLQISYIADLTQTPPTGVILVENDADYVHACAGIRDSGDCTLWVRNKHHYTWLRHFIALAGLEASAAEKTARHILADFWKVVIPDWLADEDIDNQNLLKIPPPGNPSGAGFCDLALGTLVSPELAASAITTRNLASIIEILTASDAKGAIAKYPFLSHCLEQKFTQWQQSGRDLWLPLLLQDLRDHPDRLWQELTICRLLHGYPVKFLEYAVPIHRAAYLNSVPLSALTTLPLNEVAIVQAGEQVDAYFAEVAAAPVASAEQFAELLQATSGLISKEFNFLEKQISQAKFSPQKDLIAAFREKFKNCPGISSFKLEQLRQYIVPDRPLGPDAGETWEAPRWLQWALNEYLPFRHWQTLYDEPDPGVETLVQEFSDWYLQPANYTAIHQDPDTSLVHALASWKSILGGPGLVVIALVDNLSCTFWDLLVRALSTQGLFAHAMHNRFAPLPTETATCKSLLVSGAWNASGSNYAGFLQQQSKDFWSNKPTHYYPNLKAFTAARAGHTPAVHFLNFLAVDETLHQDVETQGDTYEELLFRLFSNLSFGLTSFLQTWEGEADECDVLIVTDHGSTRILKEEWSTFDSLAVKKLFSDERHRFARMTQSEAEELPPNLWALGYRFKSPFADADVVYFIPRGHNTVKAGGNFNGYAHGGATPEEVIVPVAIFKLAPAPWKEPFIRFVSLKLDATGVASFYLSRTSQVLIELHNPNAQPVQVVRIEVEEPSTDLKDFDRPQIAPNETATVAASCYFNKSAAAAGELRIVITYEIAGSERTLQVATPARFLSAIKSGGLDLTKL